MSIWRVLICALLAMRRYNAAQEYSRRHNNARSAKVVAEMTGRAMKKREKIKQTEASSKLSRAERERRWWRKFEAGRERR